MAHERLLWEALADPCLAGPHSSQHHQVCLCLFRIRRQQVLLALLLRGQLTVWGEVFLYDVHQGMLMTSLKTQNIADKCDRHCSPFSAPELEETSATETTSPP